MKKICTIYIMIALLLGVADQSTKAQTVNTWRGDAMGGDWNEPYKWKLNHPPASGEAAHFRSDDSLVSINRTIELDNGMHLYGQELTLKGNGNINLQSQVPHERTVNIPASATGYANMTLCDNLSLNGRISLSAKGFGTSASKGSLTLKDRSTVTGGLSVGNEGVGSGQVFVKDNATFRITSLELHTTAKKGGMAEIHILGGTVRIETNDDLFKILMDDPGRKIFIGDSGTLRIESNIPIAKKKELIKQLISNGRLVAEPGCKLTPPILQDEMLIARAQSSSQSAADNTSSLLSEIDNMSNESSASATSSSDLGDLVKALHTEVASSEAAAESSKEEVEDSSKTSAAGSIVFVLLFAGGLGGLGWWANKRFGFMQKSKPAMAGGPSVSTTVVEPAREKKASKVGQSEEPKRVERVEKPVAAPAPKVEKPVAPPPAPKTEHPVAPEAFQKKTEEAMSTHETMEDDEVDTNLYDRGAMNEEPTSATSVDSTETSSPAKEEEAVKTAEPQKKESSEDWLSGHMDLLNKLK